MNRVKAIIIMLCLSATVCKAQDDIPLPACPKTPEIDLSPMSFVIGDANGDGDVNDGDVTTLGNYIVGKELPAFDEDGADVNLDGIVSIADATILIDYLIIRALQLSRSLYPPTTTPLPGG